MSTEPLKAPFPYFGGKKAVASLVWSRLGNPDNVIEPFAGSLAVLLLRPDSPRIETVNDLDSYVANFWRATQHDPEAVAAFADGPVNEVDLHSRHRWLVLSDDAVRFREKMRTDPDYYDVKVAGWWCWGLCCWIGSGWCNASQLERHQNATPALGQDGWGVTAGRSKCDPASKVRIAAHNPGSVGKGVHAGGGLPQQIPAGEGPLTGVHNDLPSLSQQLPRMTNDLALRAGPGDLPQGRPQLADAYDIGRGVNASPPGTLSQQVPYLDHDHGCLAGPRGTCAARRAWLIDWFGRLRNRLRNVRVCCGDWHRVVGSPSVTTRLGLTGVFLDPPYSRKSGRTMKLYSSDCGDVAHRVREWCQERGSDRLMRICLAGYEGEGHEALEAAGWTVEHWQAAGGYGNRTAQGRRNAGRERLWFSPHCLRGQRTLFDETPSLFA